MRPEVKNFLSRQHRLLIGAEWLPARSGQTRAVFDPGTGRQIATVAEGGAEDIDAAVVAARQAFEHGAWPALKPSERQRLMLKVADIIEAHADELAELETLDNGAPLFYSRNFFVMLAAEQFRYMAGWCTRLNGESIPISAPGEWHAYTLREPVGVVGAVVPWNVPLMMAAQKLAPAMVSGCTVVLKPAENTPLTALRLAELVLEAGVPPGVFNVVTGDGLNAGNRLVEHPDVDKITFTGSTAVGKRIVQGAAATLKRVSLELGGKSPAIVFDDADLDITIPGVANAVFFNSGQVCVAGTRLFIHKKIFDQVVSGVAEQARQLASTIGHGLNLNTRMGPLVSAEQLSRVSGYIDVGRSEGAEVVTGGGRLGDGGYFVEPTVLVNTHSRMTVVREEIFGPVVCAIPFDNDDLEALALEANNTRYGLSGSVWTRDVSKAHRMARRIRAGTIGINAHGVLDMALPLGGYKESGWGREYGIEAVHAYTEIKTVSTRL
ncbi:aldehyde dehydrogenase family protein [Pseudomonas putida]|uniref:Aldehyde dehydrogenase family protein n=2 Tax=Pseudomonas putida TaxID=303 RepID=A0A4D6XDG1_PSEPU|nr:aldehyde dehydrogenase family protein [Pseudomonas putida]QCI15506.1 aldehyde dehydrogenase family protein [Pseudomonas putida]